MNAIEKKAHIYERADLDWYCDEPRASAALFKVERFVGAIWDPCCGGGNIVKSAIAAGYVSVYGTDVVCRVPDLPSWYRGEIDYLDESLQHSADNVVMNPPFFKAKGAEAFIRKAISLARGKVCAFVDQKFLAGAGRANGLFSEHPPTRIWMITPRVSCPPGEWLAAGNKAGGGTPDYVWLVYDRTAPPTGTLFGWLKAAEPC